MTVDIGVLVLMNVSIVLLVLLGVLCLYYNGGIEWVIAVLCVYYICYFSNIINYNNYQTR